MNAIIVAGMAFVLSLLLSTGIAVIRHKNAPAPVPGASAPAPSTQPATPPKPPASPAPAPGATPPPSAVSKATTPSPASPTPPASTTSKAANVPPATTGTASPTKPSAPATPAPSVAGNVAASGKPSTSTNASAKASSPAVGANQTPPASAPVSQVARHVTATIVAPPAQQPAAYKQLGKVLTNMKPTDAAKVLGYLNDEQVTTILRQVAPRTAAALLAALPQERAGHLGQRMLESQ